MKNSTDTVLRQLLVELLERKSRLDNEVRDRQRELDRITDQIEALAALVNSDTDANDDVDNFSEWLVGISSWSEPRTGLKSFLRQYLASHASDEFTTNELTNDWIWKSGQGGDRSKIANSVRALLFAGTKEGWAERPSRGKYRLATIQESTSEE